MHNTVKEGPEDQDQESEANLLPKVDMSHLKLKEGEQIKASFNIKGAGKKPKVIKPFKGRSFIKGPGLLAPPPSPKASKKKNKSAEAAAPANMADFGDFQDGFGDFQGENAESIEWPDATPIGLTPPAGAPLDSEDAVHEPAAPDAAAEMEAEPEAEAEAGVEAEVQVEVEADANLEANADDAEVVHHEELDQSGA